MRRGAASWLMMALALGAPVFALDAPDLLNRHRQALCSEPDKLAALANLELIGTVEKYGFQGDAGVFSSPPDRFSWTLQFKMFGEKSAVRGKVGEASEMTGWRRSLSAGELNDLKALQFIFGCLYLKPDAPAPGNIQEQGQTIAARLTTVEGVAIDVVFDAQSFLLRSFSFLDSSGERREFFIDAYNAFDGIKLPALFREGGINPATYTVKQVLANKPVDPIQFAVPPELPPPDLGDRGAARIPVQSYFNLPLVKGWAGTSPALTFLLDTDLPFSVIDRSIASQLGFTPEGKFVRPSRYPVSEFSFIRVPSFVLRGVEFKDVLFLVTKMMPPSMNVQLPIHGILGADLFRQYVMELDLAGDSLRLLTPKTFTVDNRWTRISLVRRRGVYMMPARVGDLDVYLEIATSLGSAVLLADGSGSAAALARKQAVSVPAVSLGLDYGMPERIYRTDALSLGGLTLPPAFLHVARFPEGQPFPGVADGWLGMAVLKRFTAHFDWPNGVLFLEQGQDYNLPDSFNTTGLYAIKSGGKVVVQQVMKGSPADKLGIQPGDVLIQVMDYPAEQIIFDRLYGILSVAQGQSIPIKIQRDGNELPLTIVAESPF